MPIDNLGNTSHDRAQTCAKNIGWTTWPPAHWPPQHKSIETLVPLNPPISISVPADMCMIDSNKHLVDVTNKEMTIILEMYHAGLDAYDIEKWMMVPHNSILRLAYNHMSNLKHEHEVSVALAKQLMTQNNTLIRRLQKKQTETYKQF